MHHSLYLLTSFKEKLIYSFQNSHIWFFNFSQLMFNVFIFIFASILNMTFNLLDFFNASEFNIAKIENATRLSLKIK